MSGDPMLARRTRRDAPKDGPLGLPNNCQLGRLNGHGECGGDSVTTIGNVRVCERHLKLAMQIKRDADQGTDIAPRKPNTRVFRRSA